jgi:excisionase family DNA binding protein
MTDVPQLVSVVEAAGMLGLRSKNSVYRLVAEGELPVVTVGRVSKVDVRDIDEYIARNKSVAPKRRRLGAIA